MILLLPFILGLFFILTAFYIVKKSLIFFLFYSILFVYTFFAQLGYLFYPKYLSTGLPYHYYGEEAFIPYWIYTFLAFISIFLIFAIFYNKKYRTVVSIKVKPLLKKSSNFLYVTTILFYEIILTFFLIGNYENLSYVNQFVLKGNTIWFYLFSLGGVVLLSIFYKIYMEHNEKRKIFYSVLFLILFLIFSMTAIRSGQRIQIATAFLGFISSLLYLFKNKIKIERLKLKHIFLFLFICFITLLFFQGIRTTRGLDKSFTAFLTALQHPSIYFNLFLPKNLIFQDWMVPSLSLMASMEHNIIFPSKVIESNLTCSIPFIHHLSLGSIISRIVNPEGIGGYGYYILSEGYNLMGFCGFIYSAFIFVVGVRLLESLFANTNDKLFNSYMYGIMGFLAIGVVRGGQSFVFLKGLYLYFLPAIILFILATNRKIYLTRSRIKNGMVQK